MNKTRSELRKDIMTILYQINVYKKNKMEFNTDDVIKEVVEIDNEFVKEIVYGVLTYQNEIDSIANKYLNSGNIRNPIKSALSHYAEDAKFNVESGMQQQITNAKQARESYLSGLE